MSFPLFRVSTYFVRNRCLNFLLFQVLLHTTGRIIHVPVTFTHDSDVFLLSWNTTLESAESKARLYSEHFPGGGLTFNSNPQIDSGISSRGDVFVMLSANEARWVPWDLLGGTLHSIAAHYLPAEELIALELEEPQIGSRPLDGMFLLQSPGRLIWKALAWSLREAWRHGSLRKMKLHVLVHHMPDWNRQRWRDALGEADPIFGGLHWCYGPNRFDEGQRPRDNYFHKVFTMLYLARRQGYDHIISFDDDVFLPPSALAFLIDTGPQAYATHGCGVVAPLLQNGVPSVELWAESFLANDERSHFYNCFENAGLRWDHRPWESSELGPIPVPWSPNIWYGRVREKARSDFKGVHPVRGNQTCMTQAVAFAIKHMEEQWYWRDDHGFLRTHVFPYLCNNAFLMRTDFYGEALERDDLQRINGADEVPINLLLNERKLPMCFVTNSFGIHPAYNHHALREEMEAWVMAEFARITKLS